MTKDDVNKYIFNKQIPLRFVWEDNIEYVLCCYTGKNSTTGNLNALFEHWLFPYWDNDLKTPEISYIRYTEDIFCSKKPTIEECLSDFIFWFEINKSRCKKVDYYTI